MRFHTERWATTLGGFPRREHWQLHWRGRSVLHVWWTDRALRIELRLRRP